MEGIKIGFYGSSQLASLDGINRTLPQRVKKGLFLQKSGKRGPSMLLWMKRQSLKREVRGIQKRRIVNPTTSSETPLYLNCTGGPANMRDEDVAARSLSTEEITI